MEHPIHLSAFVAMVIGASLSEPHTSVSSMHTCVCMFACLDQPLIVNYMSAFKILHEDQHHHLEACEGLTVRVQHQRPERRRPEN